MLNVYDIAESTIYGPGKRLVIWLQGCNLMCKGCWSKQTWSTKPNKLYSVENILEMITEADGIEGVTILGGEPLIQRHLVLKLVKLIKLKTDKTIMLYTGLEDHEFTTTDHMIFHHLDILIKGRYREDLRDINLTWRGSSNQVVEFLSPVYSELNIPENSNTMEFTIKEDGSMVVSGYPTESYLGIIEELL